MGGIYSKMRPHSRSKGRIFAALAAAARSAGCDSRSPCYVGPQSRLQQPTALATATAAQAAATSAQAAVVTAHLAKTRTPVYATVADFIPKINKNNQTFIHSYGKYVHNSYK